MRWDWRNRRGTTACQRCSSRPPPLCSPPAKARTGPNAKARGRRCNRWSSSAGPGPRCSPAASPGRRRPNAGCSPACPNGTKRPSGRSRRKWRSTRRKCSPALAALTGQDAEQRPGQRAYAAEAAHLFEPRRREGSPHVLLAQAGTGIGKTLGYLAPASLWAEQSGGTVWVSTFTKALQRQLRRESQRAWPAARPDGTRPVVVRKGRENYLCLLNLEDALQGGFAGRAAILAQLVARWAAYSQDGDMIGGDLPGWLTTLFRQRGVAALTDRRGECVYAGCPHYRKCFIERAARASAQADLVIANHALVMVNAARGRDHAARPTRLIFDEGHHVFEAADSTFAAALTGAETIELRRWVIGPERGSKGRRRGLSARLADLASYDEAGGKAIAAARHAAEALPGDGWLQRRGRERAIGAAGSPVRRRPRHRLCPRRKRRAGSRIRPRNRGRPARRGLCPDSGRSAGGARGNPRTPDPARRAAGGAAERAARLARRPGPRPDRRRAAFAGLAGRSARRLGGAARPAGRAGRSRIRRLAGGRTQRCARIRCRPAPPLARSDEAVCPGGAGALARGDGDLGNSDGQKHGRQHRLGHRHRPQRRPAYRRRPAPRRFRQPVRLCRPGRSADRHRCAQGRYRRARRRICPADRGGGRRRAGLVHRDPAAARGPWPHRRPARPRRAAALCPACRSDRHRHAGRYFPRRSQGLIAGHRRPARRGRCPRPFAAAGGDGAGALAQAVDPAPRAPPRWRRRPLRRPPDPRPPGPGLRAADPGQRRPRAFRRPFRRLPLAAALRISAWHAGHAIDTGGGFTSRRGRCFRSARRQRDRT